MALWLVVGFYAPPPPTLQESFSGLSLCSFVHVTNAVSSCVITLVYLENTVSLMLSTTLVFTLSAVLP